MKFKKTIIYIILSIFLLIFMYNYILPFVLLQNTGRMGMHMEKDLLSNAVYYYGDFISLIFIAITVIVGVILFNKIINNGSNKCKICGQIIESNQWKMCPNCGSTLPHKGNEFTHSK